MPYKRLIFVQFASVLQRAERAECAVDGKSFAMKQIGFRTVRAVSRRTELAECAADSDSFAVQAVEFLAVWFGFAAGNLAK